MSSIRHPYTTPEKLKALVKILKAYPGDSAAAQRKRIMAALALFPCTGRELQRYLDCFNFNARIKELRRKEGCAIGMRLVRQENGAGKLHRIGLFFLEGA